MAPFVDPVQGVLEMEKVYKELEDMKLAVETLTEKYQVKSELSERLRRAHDEQLAKLQEAKAEIAKQALEIDLKAEEISLVKQMYEDLKYSFSEKESVVKQLSSANENLKRSFKEELMKLEGEKRELVSALDEANAEREDQERNISAYKEDINRLKTLLSQCQKKCSDLEEGSHAPKELRRRDEVLLKLEQEKGEVENQLKWKIEQFRHLEEAHKGMQAEFQQGKKEWELEKSNLLDEISSLQMNLDSQTGIVEDIRSKLQMCNQALVHEESRRKLLEIQISESRTFYENVVMEHEEVKSNIEKLMERRDEEIAALRNSLATKETFCKEMEFRAIHLEQDNQELHRSLKEFQEAQINEVKAATSLKALHQKFRALEQIQRDCSEKLKAKESEWITQMEMLEKDLDDHRTKLNFEEKQLWNMQLDSEGCHSLAMQQKLENEEMWVEHIILKSKYSEFCLYSENLKLDMESRSVEFERKIACLMEQFEKNNSAFLQYQVATDLRSENIDSLQARVEYLESIEQQYLLMQREVEMYKDMFEESSKNLDCFKKQASQKETDLKEDLRKASDDLDQANSVLAEKTIELGRVNFELQQMKLVVERMEKLRSDLEVELKRYNDESSVVRRDLEASILAKLEAEQALVDQKICLQKTSEEMNKKIEELQKQIVLLEEEYTKREFEVATLSILDIEKSTAKEKLKLLQAIEDEHRSFESINTEIDLLEREYAQTECEVSMIMEQEQAKFLQFMKEKVHIISDIQGQTLTLEGDLVGLVEAAATFKLVDKYVEIGTSFEGLEKFVALCIFDEQEIQYKNILISEMEEEIRILQSKLEAEEKLSSELKECIGRLRAQSMMDMFEKEKEKGLLEDELKSIQCENKSLEDSVECLKAKIKALHGIFAQLSLERKELVGQMVEFGDQLEEVTDKELMKNMKRLTQNVRYDDAVIDSKGEDLPRFNKVGNRTLLFQRNKTGRGPDRRLPLKEHNF